MAWDDTAEARIVLRADRGPVPHRRLFGGGRGQPTRCVPGADRRRRPLLQIDEAGVPRSGSCRPGLRPRDRGRLDARRRMRVSADPAISHRRAVPVHDRRASVTVVETVGRLAYLGAPTWASRPSPGWRGGGIANGRSLARPGGADGGGTAARGCGARRNPRSVDHGLERRAALGRRETRAKSA